MRGPIQRRRVAIALLLVPLALLPACAPDDGDREPLNGGPDVTESAQMTLSEADIIATRDGATVAVRVPIRRLGRAELPVEVVLALRDLDRNLIGEAHRDVTLSDELTEVVLSLDGLDPDWSTGDLNQVVLHYQIRSDGSLLFGRRSLFAAVRKRALHLVSNDTFFDGQTSWLRLVATDPVTARPLSFATVSVHLADAEDDVLVYRGETDEFGTLSAPVEASREQLGNQTLRVIVQSELGTETIERPVLVRNDQRILITTDKPLYQPGQTIHIRTLTLRRGDLLPAAQEPMVLEVLDGRGNKILRQTVTTDDFGIAAGELVLARELNLGAFVIRATLGDTVSERTVTVDRYRLPRFSVSLTPDASFYRPGQEADLEVRADYVFGEPVSAGLLSADVYQVSDAGETFIAQHSGTLDANGHATLTVAIPESFARPALDAGTAFVRVAATVTDATGEERDASAALPVTDSGLVAVALPAHDLLRDRSNRFHVLTSDPLGQPVSATCTLTATFATEQVDAATDERGAATVTLGPGFNATDTNGVDFELACADPSGNARTDHLVFPFDGQADAALAVFSDASLYRAGDLARVDIAAYGAIDRVFLDILAAGRTVATHALDVVDGGATLSVPLPFDVTGSVTLSAYTFADAGGLVRAQRLVFVEAANDLTLAFEADRSEYRPGEPGRLDITVTGADGAGVPSAVGLTIVDEAVYALQDMRPGNERIFFQLGQEALAPEVDVTGYAIGDVVNAGESSRLERDRAAEILFAASAGSPGYGLVVDTLAEHKVRAQTVTRASLDRDVDDLLEREQSRFEGLDYTRVYEEAEGILLDMRGRYFDPWGQAYRIDPEYNAYSDDVQSFRVTGAGPDERFESDDDVERLVWLDNLVWGGGRGGDDQFAGDFGEGGPMPGAPMDGANEPTQSEDETGGGDSDGDSAGPRVRRYFPETLVVEPALITDAEGRASLDVTMADSITTWRVTGMASSRAGQLGSSTAGIRVFQPFFVDIDFPVTLTQNDEVEVPVAVFNFLDAPQTVELSVEEVGSPWYDLLSPAERTVELAAREVVSVPFRVRVREVGVHDFQVVALGDTLSDAVRRPVQVLPDGEEHVLSTSDRLEGNVTTTVNLPVASIPGANVILVKLYPGLFSQVVEGLEALLGMPSGCFEQTSSTTYPNVLALNYMRLTGQVTAEIEATALGYISSGYQRLLSFEVQGGGFEWFGNTPAHRILTAYGLLEFSDMAEVFEVDPAVITRTQSWLVSQQEADGRFRAAPEGIHEGATNNFRDSDLRATAYIAFALLESGYTGAANDRAIGWIKEHTAEIDDAYTLALVANVLLSADANDPAADALLDRLESSVILEDGTAHWTSDSQSLTYGSGGGMTMETTALALYAYIRAGAYAATVERGIGYLVQNKDSFGTWSSTQATILSLRTFIALLEGGTDPANATVGVYHDGDLVESFVIDDSTADVMRLVDLRDRAHLGDNVIELTFDGTGSFLYQVVGRYYLPWPEVAPEPEPLEITVAYPSTPVAVGQPATVQVDVENNLAARAEMVMVEVGVPPGFDVDMRTLENHVAAGTFSRVDRTATGLEAYSYGLDVGTGIHFDFDIIPRFPATVQTPTSRTYLYYEPAVRGESAPVVVSAQ